MFQDKSVHRALTIRIQTFKIPRNVFLVRVGWFLKSGLLFVDSVVLEVSLQETVIVRLVLWASMRSRDKLYVRIARMECQWVLVQA